MFKKHSIQVSVVKTPAEKPESTEPTTLEHVNKLIEKISAVNVTRVAVGFVALYASVVAVNTASEIAINAAPKR